MAEGTATSIPAVGSILLASTDPDRLRAWYERAFGVTADADGFLRLGGVGLLIDGRDDVAERAAEPRVIVNLHVADAKEAAQRLDDAGATWLAALEYRADAGAWFGTVVDPDGNYVQVIELTREYWRAKQRRAREAGSLTLADASVAARLPAQNLDRARRFYAEKLGLEPTETRPGGLKYVCDGGGDFAIFASTGQPSGEHTQLGWYVDDVVATVAELRRRGVVFEEVDAPGLRAVDGIVEVEGNYPSVGVGERAAWFRDSEGNLLGIGQIIYETRND